MPAYYSSEVTNEESTTTQVFVARQPIFENSGNVFGYELLFRSGLENFFPVGTNPDVASSQVLHNSFLLFGIDVLIGGKRAFINLTRNLLVNEVATLFPAENMVVELLETIEPDEEVIALCRKLKGLGYLLALDDFVFEPKMRPLAELADIIKVDFLSTDADQRARLIREIDSKSVRYLAEKVETQEEAENARKLGYSLFQGYFFCRPKVIKGRDVPGYKLNYLQLLREAMTEDLSVEKMERIVSRDVSLAYKLLRFINSAAFGFRSRVQSIQHALVLMGVREIRKWVSLVALTGLGKDKSEELVVGSLIRARFCELLAPKVGLGHRSSDLFLMGMFSMIDAFLDRPMEEILSSLPLSDDIKIALSGGNNLFRKVYELTRAYEQGLWEGMSQYSASLDLNEEEVPQLYLQSVELTHQVYRSYQ